MRNLQTSKKSIQLKLFNNEDAESSKEYQNLIDKTHFIGSKYFALETRSEAGAKTSAEKNPTKSALKNISSAFTGIWSSPEHINIYELLLWREKAIVNSLIDSKESPLYAHICNLRQQAIGVIETKYKDVVDEFLQTLCVNSDKRREIFCGNDLLLNFVKFIHKRNLASGPKEAVAKPHQNNAVKKLTEIYILNRMILGVSSVNKNTYKSCEF